MSNFIRKTGHCYRVKNQNGFNAALYDYFDATNDGAGNSYSKEEVRRMVQDIPKGFPVSFVIIDKTFECGRLYLEYFDLNKEYKN